MKGSGLAVLLGFTLAATSRGQVVQWDIEKRDNGKELSRRAESAIEASVANEASSGGYFATVKIGTPGQKVSLQLDTGSSDVWVPATQAEICVEKTQLNPGCTYGSCKINHSCLNNTDFAELYGHVLTKFNSQPRQVQHI